MHTRWTETQNHYESLAVSLRAVLAYLDVDHPYEEVVAALGLGTLTTAAANDSLGWWCTYARDVRLVATAELYGLRLRELHPPAAALGLDRSSEFAQHFRDSYVPLIIRALDNGQLALAWRGWPAPRERLWGVLTSLKDGMIFGHTLWHEGQPMPLTGPAHQVYIAEEFRPPPQGARGQADLFTHAVRQACAVWMGADFKEAGVRLGASAYQAWQKALRSPSEKATDVLPLYRQQAQAARVHVATRSYLATWLRRVASALSGRQLELAAHWANTCDRIGQRLLPYESPEVVEELLGQPGGVDRICRALGDVCEIEAKLVAELDDLE